MRLSFAVLSPSLSMGILSGLWVRKISYYMHISTKASVFVSFTLHTVVQIIFLVSNLISLCIEFTRLWQLLQFLTVNGVQIEFQNFFHANIRANLLRFICSFYKLKGSFFFLWIALIKYFLLFLNFFLFLIIIFDCMLSFITIWECAWSVYFI